MLYEVAIKEVVVDTFEVEAESHEEALRLIEEGYSSGEFVLEPGEVEEKLMAIQSPYTSDWIEF